MVGNGAHRIVFVVVRLDLVWIDLPDVHTDMPHFDICIVSVKEVTSLLANARLYDGPISAIESSRGTTINQSSG